MMRIGVGSGLLLALYSVYIELKHSQDADFVASCDLSEYVSCSEVLSSDWSKLFSKIGLIEKDSILDAPNSYYGICCPDFSKSLNIKI